MEGPPLSIDDSLMPSNSYVGSLESYFSNNSSFLGTTSFLGSIGSVFSSTPPMPPDRVYNKSISPYNTFNKSISPMYTKPVSPYNKNMSPRMIM